MDAFPECISISENGSWSNLGSILLTLDLKEGLSQLPYVLGLIQLLLTKNPKLRRTLNEECLFGLCTRIGLLGLDVETAEGLQLAINIVNSDAFWDFVRLILHSMESSIDGHDKEPDPNSTMLHSLAAIPMAPLELIKLSKLSNKKSLTSQDSQGNTPAHIAILRKTQVGNAWNLVRSCKEVTRIRNKNGETLFDIAVRINDTWTEVHSMLLHEDPSSLESLNLRGELYPNVLSKKKISPNAIFNILRARNGFAASRHG